MSNNRQLIPHLRAMYLKYINESCRSILGDIPRLLLINQIIAVVICLLMPGSGPLYINFVFSNIIGFCCYGLLMVAKRLIWRDSEPHPFAFYLLCITLSPFGFLLGTMISASIFSFPIQHVLSLQNSYVITFVTFTTIISTLVAWSFWNRSKITALSAAAEAEKARSASIEKQAMQTQLQLLQAQIEPHMLFNTLANLQGLIAIDTERAQHMLAQLIVYLRATLSSSRAGSTTLKQEFVLIQAYLDLLAIRMGKRLSYTLELPQELELLAIPPMLLQPLVENAIKHGLEPKMDGGHIHVSVSKVQGQLHLQVRDSGLGLPFDYQEDKLSSGDNQHVGNANIRERLYAIFGAQARLSLTPNTPKGVTADLYLPFIE